MLKTDDIKILFVDDEVNILKTLNRLMSLEDFNCDYANSGKEGLELLEASKHDIIVSDMRMPEMNGDHFMALAKNIVPNSRRFILSGYADFDSMMNALNQGGVHQFISKPWDDDQLIETIKEAVEYVKVRKERDALAELTKKQANELKEINRGLENRVQARTQELKQTADMLDLSFQEINKSYGVFIDVIAQILQRRSIAPKDHINDIAETARSLSAELMHSPEEQEVVYKAAKLHELGKVEIPESVLQKPLNQLHGKELTDYKRYPFQGYSLLTSLENLSEVSNIIKAHCERFDGKGFPSRLAGKDIPIGARIIAVSMSYFLYRNGLIDGISHDDEACLAFLKVSSGKALDPNLIEPFIKVVSAQLEQKGQFEGRIPLKQTKAGMVLSRDLFNGRGMIMLTKGAVLTERIIEKLRFISEKDGMDYVLYIEQE